MSSLDSFFKNEERRKKEEKPRQEKRNKNADVKQKPRKSLLLQGKIVVFCPKLGEEVSAKRYCLNCEHFSHVSFEGRFTAWIACNYNYKGKP